MSSLGRLDFGAGWGGGLRTASCDRHRRTAVSEFAGGREIHALGQAHGQRGVEYVAGSGSIHGLDFRRWEVAGFEVTHQNAALLTQLHDNDGRASAPQQAADVSRLNRI